jgi:prevent-host-death family protein
MRRVTVREARANLSSLLDAASGGEEIIIERQGRPTARLVCLAPEVGPRLTSRAEFRSSITPGKISAGEAVRLGRDEERA